jgi:hypothetical protein
MDDPVGSHSGKKPNKNYTRAGDHTRAHRAPATHLIEGGAPPFDQAQRAALPTSTVSSSASEARAEIGYASASQPAARSPAIGGHSLATPTAPSRAQTATNLPRRRTNDWDLPPAPGPRGQTAFLKHFEAFKAGDIHALDPLAGLPLSGASAYSIESRNTIRAQMGMPLLEDYDEAHTPPPAYQDDDAVIRGNEQPPSRSSPETDQAAPRDGDPETPSGQLAAKHADPRNPNNESKPPMSDEDFGGLP